MSILLNTNMEALKNATTMVNLGLEAMGGMETDFQCAGMCDKPATFYTFSDVTQGPPKRNCSIAVENWLNDAAPYTQGSLLSFGFAMLICGAFMCLLWSNKHHSIESPLLSRYY